MKAKNKERIQTTSCGAIATRIVNEQLEILLIKQFAHKNRWGIPKGHQNPGETLEQCAMREVKEEAGVVVELGVKLQNCLVINDYEEKTVHTWLAVPVGSHETNHNDPDSEVADARWFNVNELPDIMSYQRSVVSDAIALAKARHSLNR